MRRIKSMFLTILCAFIILGAGYLGIEESGRRILEGGNTLEETDYENTSSKIFYGKIEDDVELFPWNYYPVDARAKNETSVPLFLEEGMIGRQVETSEKDKETEDAQNTYFIQMIAHESNTDEKHVWNWYEKNKKSIMGSMVAEETPLFGMLYFYQDTIELGKEFYQVRIACNDWNIISFTCVKSGREEASERKVLEEGKERLAEILEGSEQEMAEYFAYMMGLQDLGLSEIGVYSGEMSDAYLGNMPLYYDYFSEDGVDKSINTHLQGLMWLDDIMKKSGTGASLDIMKDAGNQEIIRLIEAYGSGTVTDNAGTNAVNDDTDDIESGMDDNGEESVTADSDMFSDVDYEMGENSYQIVELKNMILLLMQGDTATLGIYYDPMNRKFCGYYYFYE